jgi:hypothetical protein
VALTASTLPGLAGREVIIQLFVEPLASARGNLESSAVSHELDHVPCAIQDSAAVGTVFEVGGHHGTEPRIDFVVKVV